jgi:hypothetical protein
MSSEKPPRLNYKEHSSLSLPRKLIEHALTTRTSPRRFLREMKQHLIDGDITLEGVNDILAQLDSYTPEINRQLMISVFKTLLEKYPQATNVLTYAQGWMLNEALSAHRMKKWPAKYALTHLEVDARTPSAYFFDIDLSELDIQTLIDSKKNIESLEKDSIVVSRSIEWKVAKREHVGICQEAEVLFSDLLAQRPYPSKRKEKGIILTQGQKVVGLYKFPGADSFLALRTVRNPDGTVQCHRGMLYALGSGVEITLLTLLNDRIEHHGTPRRKYFSSIDLVDLEFHCSDKGKYLSKNAMRFIEPTITDGDESIYDLMSEFIQLVESEEITTVPLV